MPFRVPNNYRVDQGYDRGRDPTVAELREYVAWLAVELVTATSALGALEGRAEVAPKPPKEKP